MLLAMFFNELFRIDIKHIKCCIILTIINTLFNFFLLLGSNGLSSVTISCVLSSYFIFIPVIEIVFYKNKPRLNTIIAIFIVLLGLFFIIELDVNSLLNKNILYLLIADFAFAIYIILTGKYSKESSPSIVAMGQLFFNTVLALICWFVESKIRGVSMSLPSDLRFWGSVIFISFFIRGMYGVVQIYAQRYVSPINTSLIFSTAIIMTMLFSGIAAKIFELEVPNDNISIYKIVGSVLMVVGILIADDSIINFLFNNKRMEQKS